MSGTDTPLGCTSTTASSEVADIMAQQPVDVTQQSFVDPNIYSNLQQGIVDLYLPLFDIKTRH